MEVMSTEIRLGGIFIVHDIYYPKSIKEFQVLKIIENDESWEILEKTNSKQGMLIARKIL